MKVGQSITQAYQAPSIPVTNEERMDQGKGQSSVTTATDSVSISKEALSLLNQQDTGMTTNSAGGTTLPPLPDKKVT